MTTLFIDIPGAGVVIMIPLTLGFQFLVNYLFIKQNILSNNYKIHYFLEAFCKQESNKTLVSF